MALQVLHHPNVKDKALNLRKYRFYLEDKTFYSYKFFFKEEQRVDVPGQF